MRTIKSQAVRGHRFTLTGTDCWLRRSHIAGIMELLRTPSKCIGMVTYIGTMVLVRATAQPVVATQIRVSPTADPDTMNPSRLAGASAEATSYKR